MIENERLKALVEEYITSLEPQFEHYLSLKPGKTNPVFDTNRIHHLNGALNIIKQSAKRFDAMLDTRDEGVFTDSDKQEALKLYQEKLEERISRFSSQYLED